MSSAVENAPTPLRGAQIWPLSVAAYHTLGEAGLIPENTELLYGIVYRKMPKSAYHSALVTRLFDLLNSSVPPGFFLRIEQPITCQDSEPEPDLALIQGAKEDFWERHPRTAELVIDVCVTSHDYDRFKLRSYALAGVKECWLVLGPEKQIEVFRYPKSGEFTHRSVHGLAEAITSAVSPPLTILLEALFTK
jgi:Uma2 family endonuclease